MNTINRDQSTKIAPCGEEFATSVDAISHERHCDQCAGVVEATKADDLAKARQMRADLVEMSQHYRIGSIERAQLSAARLGVQRLILRLGDYE